MAPRNPFRSSRWLGLFAAFGLLLAAGVAVRGCPEPRPVPEPGSQEVEWRSRFRIPASPGTRTLTLRCRLPTDRVGQEHLGRRIEPLPDDSGIDEAGRWIGWRLVPDRERTVEVALQLRLQGAYGQSGPDPTDLECDTLRPCRDPRFREWAASQGGRDTLEILQRAWETVLGLTYRFDPVDRGAGAAWENGTGDCSEFSDLFVTLARAAGIPSRSVRGWTDSAGTAVRHQWAEGWIPGRGWMGFDPAWGKSGSARFGEALPGLRVRTGSGLPEGAMEGQPYSRWKWEGDSLAVEFRQFLSRLP